MAGTLYTYGSQLRDTADYFESFDTIAYSPTDLTSQVRLKLSAAGSVDIHTQLGTRSVYLEGSDGNDVIEAGDGNDVLIGGWGNDRLIGNGGDDQLIVWSGTEHVEGGDGDDRIDIDNNVNGTIDGGAGTDTVFSRSSFETVLGNVLTFTGVERLYAFTRTAGSAAQFESFDRIAADAAFTTAATLRLTSPGVLDLADETAGIGVILTGSTGDDTLTGSDVADTIAGGSGNDTIHGGGGDDKLTDSGGNDTLIGGDGDDHIGDYGGSVTHIEGGAGADRISLITVMSGSVDGGTGTDTLLLSGSATNVSGLNISNVERLVASNQVTGTAAQFEDFDRIAANATFTTRASVKLAAAGVLDLADETADIGIGLTGSAGDDTLTTSNVKDIVSAGAGNDVVHSGAGNDDVHGGDGDDTLDAGTGNDVVSGGNGNDSIDAGEGDDTLSGEAGNDILTGGSGKDTLIGGLGDDHLGGGDGNDFLRADNDTSGQGEPTATDWLDGGAGDDSIVDRSGTTHIDAGSGNDRIQIGTNMSGSIVGGTGTDTLYFSTSTGVSLGSLALTGVEILETSGQRITGTGTQFESFAIIRVDSTRPQAAVALALSSGGTANLADELSGRSVDIQGSAGNDNITTANKNDTIDGGAGNDVLRAGDGDDVITDLAGSTTAIYGDGGNDLITIRGGLAGRIDGGAGIDTMHATAADVLGDLDIRNVENLYTEGYDIVGTAAQFESFTTIARDTQGPGVRVYLTLSEGGSVDLAAELSGRAVTFTGSGDADTIVTSNGDDVVDGRYGDDRLTGGDGNDKLYGGEDNDVLKGGNGTDTLSGGTGDDTLAGGVGADAMSGGGGVDVLNYYGSTAAVSVSLWSGDASGGDATGDTFTSIESLIGSNFDDLLSGEDGVNMLRGLDGDDRLLGRGGADRLIGEGGSDTATYLTSSQGVTVNLATGLATGGDAEGDTFSSIENLQGSRYSDVLTGDAGVNRIDGGDRNDTLSGGLGNDVLTGGTGADRFVFDTAVGPTNVDTITDMVAGQDTINLSTAIFVALQGGATPGSLSSASFRYSADPSSSGGLGEIIYNATAGTLSYDADGAGAGAAVQFATVSAGLNLAASDFRLV